MDYYEILNLVSAALVIGASVTTFIMARKITQSSPKILTVLLSSFLLVHGLYHLTYFSENFFSLDYLGYLSDSFIEPLGWAILLAFAVYLARRS